MRKKNTQIENIKGIRISVKSKFKKPFFKQNKLFYLFRSSIVVHNFGNSNIQILSNYKSILEPFFKKDSILKFTIKPQLKPGKKVKIYLDHFLKSKAGIVNGYFSMISLDNSKKFKAYFPPIKLTHPEILN